MNRPLVRVLIVVAGSVAYWVAALCIWMFTALAFLLGDCFGNTVCQHDKQVAGVGLLAFAALLCAAYVGGLIWLFRAWRPKPPPAEAAFD